MGNIINTAPCRFCGQMVQIDSEEKLTQPQAEEQATMSCTCEQAVEYQKEKQRKEKAMQNVAALFGEAAALERIVRCFLRFHRCNETPFLVFPVSDLRNCSESLDLCISYLCDNVLVILHVCEILVVYLLTVLDDPNPVRTFKQRHNILDRHPAAPPHFFLGLLSLISPFLRMLLFGISMTIFSIASCFPLARPITIMTSFILQLLRDKYFLMTSIASSAE